MSSADVGGIPYHFYNRLLQDTLTSSGIIGIAYDIGRNDFMDNTGFWLPAYHYNLFGDPALRQYGQLVAVREGTIQKLNHAFNVLPNPSRGIVTVEMQLTPSSTVEFQVYDISGRLVTNLIPDEQESGFVSFDLHLPSGIYFITCIEGGITFQRKIAVVD